MIVIFLFEQNPDEQNPDEQNPDKVKKFLV